MATPNPTNLHPGPGVHILARDASPDAVLRVIKRSRKHLDAPSCSGAPIPAQPAARIPASPEAWALYPI